MSSETQADRRGDCGVLQKVVRTANGEKSDCIQVIGLWDIVVNETIGTGKYRRNRKMLCF